MVFFFRREADTALRRIKKNKKKAKVAEPKIRDSSNHPCVRSRTNQKTPKEIRAVTAR
jgi:hypothetical protein